jgi:hypothetical protein
MWIASKASSAVGSRPLDEPSSRHYWQIAPPTTPNFFIKNKTNKKNLQDRCSKTLANEITRSKRNHKLQHKTQRKFTERPRGKNSFATPTNKREDEKTCRISSRENCWEKIESKSATILRVVVVEQLLRRKKNVLGAARNPRNPNGHGWQEKPPSHERGPP